MLKLEVRYLTVLSTAVLYSINCNCKIMFLFSNTPLLKKRHAPAGVFIARSSNLVDFGPV